ncbi:hypothetical protein KR009_009120, partial [Drosophila setifemur]
QPIFPTESLDETTPLPELSFEDFLEPTTEKGGQHMDIDVVQSDEDGALTEEEQVDPANDSLNTPQFKKNMVHILEDKRLTTPGLTVLKSHAIKVVTAGSGVGFGTGTGATVSTSAPLKAQITDVKILNKLKPIASNTVKIGNTTIATTPGGVTKTLNTMAMTQIKTPDGRVLFVQKSVPGTSALVAGSQTGGIRRLVAPTGIQKAVLSKGVTIAGTGLVKATVPGKVGHPTTSTGGSTFTIKGITPLVGASAKPSSSPVTSPSSTVSASTTGQPTKIHVVRTTDGKYIKINQASSSLLLNAKPQGTGTTPVKLPPTAGNVVVGKPVGQVVLKAGTPLKQGVTQGTASPGKMLVQSAGKQIVVSSKNIIKLSPKPGATSSITNTGGSTPGGASSSGLHAIQLPGKGGVQYVRVLTNTKGAAGASAAPAAVPKTTPVQKVTVVRSPSGATASSTGSATATAATSTASGTKALGSTSQIVLRGTGGNIVPLPHMATLVSKRALGANTNANATESPTSTSSNSTSPDSPRKHRLTDLNMQLKHLTAGSDASDSSDPGPEAKKPRYVITMHQGKQRMQSTSQQGPNLVGRQQANSNSTTSSPNAPKKIYNFVKSTGSNGVKYMICNSGVPQTSTSSMRRGYTGYVDNKVRQPMPMASQQQRFKQMNPQQQAKHLQLQAQAKQRIRQQQLQNQNQSQPKPAPVQQQTLPTLANSSKAPAPGKPLFDILKPPAAGAAPAIDALAGLTSRRKHCNCSKSQCLKLYCDCFANGEFCQDCTCKDCFNNLDYEVERERAIRSCLDRNPSAFKPKITAPNSGDMRLHNKGCNCKRSGCLKNYCECYEAKIPCTSICKCVGCRNMEDRPDVDMDSLDGMMGTQSSQKAKEGHDKHGQENRSNLYLTDDVIEATIMCMISRIVMHEKQSMPIEDTEREVMEELGESLNQIITFAKEKHDTSQLDDSKTTV